MMHIKHCLFAPFVARKSANCPVKHSEMRWAHLWIILFCLLPLSMSAQTFTSRLQQKKAGQGTVVIFQDQTIDDLVNGKNKKAVTPVAKREPEEKTIQGRPDGTEITGADSSTVRGKTYRRSYSTAGFRIQLFLGDDSRVSRSKAYAAGSKFKTSFPDTPVYTHFYSPHWICRAGDFSTYEEAKEMLGKLQQSGGFKEASIVKCKILVAY